MWPTLPIVSAKRLLEPLAVVLVTLCLVSTACDERLTTPTRVDLTGRWRLSSIQPRGVRSIALPRDTAVGIEFTDIQLSVQSDCNVCSGRYTATGGAFSISLLACTRRACREGSIEGPYLQLLSTASGIAIVPERALRLEGPNGALVFLR